MSDYLSFLKKSFEMIEKAIPYSADNMLQRIAKMINDLYDLQENSPEEISEFYNQAIVNLERIEDYFRDHQE